MQAPPPLPSASDLLAAVRTRAAHAPDLPAIAAPGGVRTWAALHRASDALAHGLRAAGVRPGDRVAVTLPAGPEAFTALAAVWKLGGCAVWSGPRASWPQLAELVARTAPTAVVAPSAVHARARTVGRWAFASVRVSITHGSRWFWRGPTLAALEAAPTVLGPPTRPDVAPDSDALVIDAGDTGPPLVLSRASLAARAARLRMDLGLEADDSVVVSERWMAVAALVGGVAVVMPDERGQPGEALVDATRVHRARVVIAGLAAWRAVPEHGERLTELRLAVFVGAGLAASDLARLTRILPDSCSRVGAFGDAEAFPIATFDATELFLAPRTASAPDGACVGRPTPTAWVRIARDVDGPIHHWQTRRALGPGDQGEIVVGGDGVCAGYAWDGDRAAARKIAYGNRTLHRTGWLGQFDHSGRLWVAGPKA